MKHTSPVCVPFLACLLAFLAPGAAAQTLDLFDVTLNQNLGQAPASIYLGHDVRFDIDGSSGEVGAVFASALPAPFPIDIGGVPVVLDPGNSIVLGLTVLDPTGQGSVSVSVPSTLPSGPTLYTQALLVHPVALTSRVTSGMTPALASEPFTTLLAGSQSAHPLADSGGVAVIDGASAWTTFWTQHAAFQIPAPPPPAVDFQTSAVVAVFAGWRPSSGYSIGVDEITYTGSGLDVDATAVAPGAGCGVLTVITYPHHFVLIDADVAAPATLTTALTSGTPCP